MQQSVWRDERTYTVEEYLKAYEGREGRYELVDGKVIKMAAELNLHNYVKGRLFLLVEQGVQQSGAPLVVFTNGVTLKIRSDRAREPDLSVAWASDVDYALMTIDAPVILAEVLSPSSRRPDRTAKLAEYFGFASLQHYLIVDPAERAVTHYRRGAGDAPDAGRSVADEISLDVAGSRAFVVSFDVKRLWPANR